MAEELKVYIHQFNFCHLKIDLKANEASQEVIEEIKSFLDIMLKITFILVLYYDGIIMNTPVEVKLLKHRI